MLKHEVLEVLSIDEYQGFLAYRKTLPKQMTILLPDGRHIEWFEEQDLHTYIFRKEREVVIEAINQAGSDGCPIPGNKPVVSGDVPVVNEDRRQLELFSNNNISK